VSVSRRISRVTKPHEDVKFTTTNKRPIFFLARLISDLGSVESLCYEFQNFQSILKSRIICRSTIDGSDEVWWQIHMSKSKKGMKLQS
jgi:hypothetical protein